MNLPHRNAPRCALPARKQEQKQQYFDLAHPLEPVEQNPVVGRFSKLAKELGVVLPSERRGWTRFPCTSVLHYNMVCITAWSIVAH